MVTFGASVVGKKVRFINNELHEYQPDVYPEYGTVGIILNSCLNKYNPYVQWPSGATSKHNRCFYSSYDLELVEQEPEEERTFILFVEYDNNEFVARRHFVCRAENEELAKYLVETRIRIDKTTSVKFLSVREMDANEVFVGW